MKRAIMFMLIAASLVAADKVIFTGFSVGYQTMLSPSSVKSASTNLYDTVSVDGVVGATIIPWVDVYAGLGFSLFIVTNDVQQYFSFLPLYAGVAVNPFPDWTFRPQVFAEAGIAFNNRHNHVGISHSDVSWNGFFTSVGAAVCYEFVNNSILSLRAALSFYPKPDFLTDGFMALKIGFGWRNYF